MNRTWYEKTIISLERTVPSNENHHCCSCFLRKK